MQTDRRIREYIPLLTHRIEHIEVPNNEDVHPYNILYQKKQPITTTRPRTRLDNAVFERLLQGQTNATVDRADAPEYEPRLSDTFSHGYGDLDEQKMISARKYMEDSPLNSRMLKGEGQARLQVFSQENQGPPNPQSQKREDFLEKASLRLSKLEQLQRELDEKKQAALAKKKEDEERSKSTMQVLPSVQVLPQASQKNERPLTNSSGLNGKPSITIDVGKLMLSGDDLQPNRQSQNFMQTANESIDLKSFEDSMLEDIQVRIKNLEDQLYKKLSRKDRVDV